LTTDQSERPFNVLGLEQVALGASARSRFYRLWVELLGLPIVGHTRSESENVLEDRLRLPPSGLGVEVTLMEPVDPKRRPWVHVPPLNHIGLLVDDVQAAYEYLSARGVRFTDGGVRAGEGDMRICFIHPQPSDTHPARSSSRQSRPASCGGRST
jgi:lactoylglutathione lyase